MQNEINKIAVVSKETNMIFECEELRNYRDVKLYDACNEHNTAAFSRPLTGVRLSGMCLPGMHVDAWRART